MSLNHLIREVGTRRVTNDRQVHCTVLSDAGLKALLERGWMPLAEALETPGTQFVSEPQDRGGGPWLPNTSEPFVVDEQRTADGVQLLLHVHAGIRWFEGHFPTRPLYPGIAQIDFAGRTAARLGLARGRFVGLSRIKFATPMPPDSVVMMQLTAAPGRVAFTQQSAHGIFSKGTLHFGE